MSDSSPYAEQQAADALAQQRIKEAEKAAADAEAARAAREAAEAARRR
ncbi:hypothetical protein [Streptomyces nitrosporeus]|nr:hypothetical protein [Streptomyces nitrosporeus]GGZ27760.1 hypothetical protein GCM10010327_67700 [Streptomyces nitrosporeus]